jgi:hypothetical protein
MKKFNNSNCRRHLAKPELSKNFSVFKTTEVDLFSLFLQLVLNVRTVALSYCTVKAISYYQLLLLSFKSYRLSAVNCRCLQHRRSTVSVNIDLSQYSDSIDVSQNHKKRGVQNTDKRRKVMDGCTSNSLANIGIHAPLPLMIPLFYLSGWMFAVF